jgi:hypothetical protein
MASMMDSGEDLNPSPSLAWAQILSRVAAVEEARPAKALSPCGHNISHGGFRNEATDE